MLKSPECIFIVLTNLLILCLSFSDKILGPANLIFKKFEPCQPPSSDIDISVSQRKYNRTTHVFDVSIETPWPLGDNIILELSVSIKKQGGYKPGYYYLKDKFCTVIKNCFDDVFQRFLEVVEVDGCPMPSGLYNVKDFYLDNNDMPEKTLYGDYKVVAKLYLSDDDDLKACNVVYVAMEPRDMDQ